MGKGAQAINPQVDDIYTVQPEIVVYDGYHKILRIRSGVKYSWFLSLQKAKVLMDYPNEINHFVETNGSEAYSFYPKGEKNCPLLLMQNHHTSSTKYYQLSIGLHRAKLVLHWWDWIKTFAETEGEYCNPHYHNENTDKTLF